MTINHKLEFMTKHSLTEDQFQQFSNPYFFTMDITCIESMPIGEEERIKSSLMPYVPENDEYLTCDTIISSYSSYIGDSDSDDDNDEENEEQDESNLILHGRFVDYSDIHFFGMEKDSAINGIGEDSNMFIIREVHSDYTGLDIFYKEESLTEHLQKRFSASELPLNDFLLRETFLDNYKKELIIDSIDTLILENNAYFIYILQRNAYGYIII
jgi:hypothetical protein